MCVDIYSSKTMAWIFKESNWGQEATVFLNGCLHYIGSARVTVVYLLWIWRERHGGNFLIGHVIFHAPSIKLRVTCVTVLLVVAICPSFQSGSLKTMVLIINGH